MSERERVRVGQIFLWSIVGLAVIVGATVLVNGWTDRIYWSSVLVNLGATILLAGFLVWLERRIVTHATVAATEAATDSARTVAEDIARTATRELGARIDSLQAELSAASATAEAAQDAAVDGLSTEVSRQGLLDALNAAREIGEIGAEVYVLGGKALGGPVVRISLPREPTLNDDGRDLEMAVEDKWSWRGVEWTDGRDPIDVFAELQRAMVAAGMGARAKAFDAEALLGALRRGLREGIEGRRGEDGAWRSASSLLEIIDSEWVVSDAGVEHRGHGIVVPASFYDVPSYVPPHQRVAYPAKPDWASDQDWRYVVERGRVHLAPTRF